MAGIYSNCSTYKIKIIHTNNKKFRQQMSKQCNIRVHLFVWDWDVFARFCSQQVVDGMLELRPILCFIVFYCDGHHNYKQMCTITLSLSTELPNYLRFYIHRQINVCNFNPKPNPGLTICNPIIMPFESAPSPVIRPYVFPRLLANVYLLSLQGKPTKNAPKHLNIWCEKIRSQATAHCWSRPTHNKYHSRR